LAVPFVGRAQALAVVFDDLSSPANISVWRHNEVLDSVEPADAVPGVDSSLEFKERMLPALMEPAVDGLLDKPEVERDEIVVGSAEDDEGAVDIGDVAGHETSTDLLNENR
jgi:hypothetical protein